MEPTSPPVLRLVILGALLALGAAFLILRARRSAASTGLDEVTRARLRRVCWSFLVINGVLVVVGGLAGVVSAMSLSSTETEGYGMLAGMFATVTIWIALPIAAYNSLRLWGQRTVGVLWLLLVSMIAAITLLMDTDWYAWLVVPMLIYLACTTVLSVRGLQAARVAAKRP